MLKLLSAPEKAAIGLYLFAKTAQITEDRAINIAKTIKNHPIICKLSLIGDISSILEGS